MKINRTFSIDSELYNNYLCKESNQSLLIDKLLRKHYMRHAKQNTQDLTIIAEEMEKARSIYEMNKEILERSAELEKRKEQINLPAPIVNWLKNTAELPKRDMEIIERWQELTGDKYPLDMKVSDIRHAHDVLRL